jgi:hypothetical protein
MSHQPPPRKEHAPGYNLMDLDLRVTRNGVYPTYYIIQESGKAPMIKKWEENTQEEKKNLMNAFSQNKKCLTQTTYTPIENRWYSILLDIRDIEVFYPAYHHVILYMILSGVREDNQIDDVFRTFIHEDAFEAREGSGVVKDSTPKGLWYYVLERIASAHTRHLVHHQLPRARFNNASYPSWCWMEVGNRVFKDVIEHHLEDWYMHFCKPKLEDTNPKPGIFFMAMEMLLDYITDLVASKYKDLMDMYLMDEEHNNTLDVAFHVLRIHRQKEYDLMMHRFFEHDQNLEGYHPLNLG